MVLFLSQSRLIRTHCDFLHNKVVIYQYNISSDKYSALVLPNIILKSVQNDLII